MKILLLAVLLASSVVHAERNCSTPSENHQRLAFIQSRLSDDARQARLWTGAWGAGYGLLTLGQLAAIPLAPEADVDLYVGALSSAGALAVVLVQPLEVMAHSLTLDALALAHPTDVDCEVLTTAERLLVESARSEALGRSPWMHGANVVYSLLSLGVLGLVFDRWVSGLINAAIGILLGEWMILSQPTGAEDTLRRYLAGEWDAPATTTAAPGWHRPLTVSPFHAGVRLGFSF